MKPASSHDAVGFFSENAEQFHTLYASESGFRERLTLWHGLLDRYAQPGSFALDMGCGAGVFSFYLAGKGARVVGVDGAPDMIALCEKQRVERGVEGVRFVQGRLPDIDSAGLDGASLVISSSVLEYVGDLEATFALFDRLLAPAGTLIVSMPNASSLSRNYQRLKQLVLRRPDVYRFIKHYSSPAILERMLRARGFSLLESHYYTHTTRLAKIARGLKLPLPLSEDLFVAVFRKA